MATGICTHNYVKIDPAVPEICSRTDRKTDRRIDHNTPQPYQDGVTIMSDGTHCSLLQLINVTSLYIATISYRSVYDWCLHWLC